SSPSGSATRSSSSRSSSTRPIPRCGRPPPTARARTAMGEHGTWFDYLNRFEWWRHFDHWAGSTLGRTRGTAMFPSGFTLTHVLLTIVVVLFATWGAIAFYRGTQQGDRGLVPPRRFTFRNCFEIIAESLYGFVEGAMGEAAPRFYPLIGALFIF